MARIANPYHAENRGVSLDEIYEMGYFVIQTSFSIFSFQGT